MLHVVDNPSTNPYFNVALDSWLVRQAPSDQDFVMLWRNRPAVIIGRYQNTHQEVNVEYAEDHDIAIVRRMSGGGAVYHDLGNLNFSLIVSTKDHSFNDYESFTRPVIAALAYYGVKAELQGRNDVTLAGKKFSGNAQYRTASRLLHHGTILFDEDLDVVPQVLEVRQDKIATKGIKSVRSRITNIRPYLPADINLAKFRGTLLKFLGEYNGGISGEYDLASPQLRQIEAWVSQRFGQWSWNFGQSPPFNYTGRERFPKGELEVRVNVVHGVIQHMTIYGDFLGNQAVDPLLGSLNGVTYSHESVELALQEIRVEDYLGGITRSEFLKVLFDMTPT